MQRATDTSGMAEAMAQLDVSVSVCPSSRSGLDLCFGRWPGPAGGRWHGSSVLTAAATTRRPV
jgi:hypothetical protein